MPKVKVAFVTTNFLSMLGVRPALGRTFAPEEQFSGHSAIVLTYGLWQRRFGGDPSILGKAMPFLGGSAVVIGVMPEDFQLHFPPDSNVPPGVAVFYPFDSSIYKDPRTLYYLRVLGRLKSGVTAEQAQADMNQVAGQIQDAYVEFKAENMQLEAAPLQRDAFAILGLL